MQITLGNTTSPQRKIYKNFTDQVNYTVNFKDDEDVVNPVLIMTYVSGIDRFNYAYIPQLHRYYWVTDVQELIGGMCALYLKCDVLMTYKPDIDASELLLTRLGTGGSTMIPDSKLPIAPYRDISIVEFEEKPFTYSKASDVFVLCVAGK